jgi:hypothetical protein
MLTLVGRRAVGGRIQPILSLSIGAHGLRVRDLYELAHGRRIRLLPPSQTP